MMASLVYTEVAIILGFAAMVAWSLVLDRNKRVVGRLTLIAILFVVLALVITRANLVGVLTSEPWPLLLGQVGVCAVVAMVTWQLSDTHIYDNWLATFARQAFQSIAIPLFSFSWVVHHLIFVPLIYMDIPEWPLPVMLAGSVLIPVSVAYFSVWQLLPSWVSHVGVIFTFAMTISSMVVVSTGEPWGLLISLIGTLIGVGYAVYIAVVHGFSNWMHLPPVPRGNSVFTVAAYIILLIGLPLVSLYTQAHTTSWVTVIVLVATIAGISFMLIDAIQTLFRETQALKKVETELHQIEFVDPLTRIANRVGFQEALLNALATIGSRSIAVYHIDLGGFRAVNDSIGSYLGDEVLTIVADRLGHQIGSTDTLARLAGDEFGVILYDCQEEDNAMALAERLHHAITQPIELGIGWRVVLDAAIGVVLATGNDVMGDVMRFADAALHQAKVEENRHIAMLGADDLRASVAAFANDQRLRTAFLQDQFVLFVQPVVDLETGHTVGFEALSRWPGATLGPAEFIPLIEENGLADAFGSWVLRNATAWAAQHRCEIAINISPRHMHSPNFVDDVLHALDQSGLPGELLLLEITERSAMPDIERTNAMLNRLRDQGVRIAVDDFGTGEFSLQQLMEYPIDVLKIDRSFVSGIQHNLADTTLVKSLIHAANGLGITTIAEGVEDSATAAQLALFGCNQAQGYHWGAPMALGEGVQWWNEHKG